MTYATTVELNEKMFMDAHIPDRTIVGANRSLEEVGTGDGNTTRFLTDHAFIIAETYTFYYGSTEAIALNQALTETTHYTLDKDNGILTLTTAGKTLVSTNKIYAAYEYNYIGISDSELQATLDAAVSEIDDSTLNHWATGTDTTPDYTQVTNEKQTGKGRFDRDYFLERFPLPDVSTQLSIAVIVGGTTLNVDSTAGFPDTGIISIGSEKFVYSAKTATTFTVPAATATHDVDDYVYPWAFEVSTADSGSTPSWIVLQVDVDYDLDKASGRVHIYDETVNLASFNSESPVRGVPNRFRANYIWGNSTIPDEIKRLNLMIAARDLLHSAVRKAHTNGMNDFKPSLIEVDKEWIESTLDKYRNMQIDNV